MFGSLKGNRVDLKGVNLGGVRFSDADFKYASLDGTNPYVTRADDCNEVTIIHIGYHRVVFLPTGDRIQIGCKVAHIDWWLSDEALSFGQAEEVSRGMCLRMQNIMRFVKGQV
jgi:hypothetical protein